MMQAKDLCQKKKERKRIRKRIKVNIYIFILPTLEYVYKILKRPYLTLFQVEWEHL